PQSHSDRLLFEASTGPMPALCALLNLIDDPSEAAYRDIPFPEGGTVKPAWRDVKNTADEIASLPLAGKIERLAERFFPELRSSYTGALERLKRLSTMYSRASDLVSAVSVEQAQDGFNPKTEAVALMTIHAAKGLEFPVVFIAGCEEGILPFTLFDTGEERIEEEKRLFYVGMTRAGERLFISHATSRSLFGRKLKLGPSRFLSLIHDADCVDIDPGTVHRGRTLQFDLFE
ncbi:MAG TPA: ATP-dependent helicase, partial [Spirochaetia bacterium]|nr:ATP-dependent helicase [Spirochaetia bacterium]